MEDSWDQFKSVEYHKQVTNINKFIYLRGQLVGLMLTDPNHSNTAVTLWNCS